MSLKNVHAKCAYLEGMQKKRKRPALFNRNVLHTIPYGLKYRTWEANAKLQSEEYRIQRHQKVTQNVSKDELPIWSVQMQMCAHFHQSRKMKIVKGKE